MKKNANRKEEASKLPQINSVAMQIENLHFSILNIMDCAAVLRSCRIVIIL